MVILQGMRFPILPCTLIKMGAQNYIQHFRIGTVIQTLVGNIHSSGLTLCERACGGLCFPKMDVSITFIPFVLLEPCHGPTKWWHLILLPLDLGVPVPHL